MGTGDASLELLLAREINRRLLEVMPGGVVHVGTDGAVLFANGEALRILGLSYDELTEKYTFDFDSQTIHEDGSHCPVEEYPVARVLMTGEAQPPMTLGVRKPNGTLSWATFSAMPIKDDNALKGAIVTFLDVTERKKSELALLESRARLSAIMESVPSYVISIDLEGRITYINRLPAEMSADAVIGQYVWELSSDERYRKEGQEMFRRVVTTRSFERAEVIGPLGRPYALRAGPVIVEGQLTGITLVGTDLAYEKDLEARVLVTDRLASIGTLAAGVAHEINNPLTYLSANLELAEKEIHRRGHLSPESGLPRLRAASEGAERIRNIVRDLRSFAHVESGKPKRIDVRELLDSSLRMAEGEVRYRAKVVRDYGEGLSLVADDSRLGQVFLNLIVNAAQAIPEGDVERNEIRVSAQCIGERIIVEVSDTGAGVPGEVREKIFNPFFTTKDQGAGMGLGLYLCRNIVTSMDGEITISDNDPRGTRFTVSLPTNASAAERLVVPAAPTRSLRRSKLLIVDDERNILTALTMLLDDHEVKTTSSGREALTALQTGAFDLVLCDIMMPDMTGMDIFEEARATSPDLARKFVFMTGGTFTERAHRFLDTVQNPVLKKPFTEEELFEVLEASISGR